MLGDGTSPAITIIDMETARLLDLTRSLRRAGRVATGVDRVERAYLAQFVAESVPAFALLRTAFGYLLLDHKGMLKFLAQLEGRSAWPKADFLSRVSKRRNVALMRAESSARKVAIARCLPSRLRKMLEQYLPQGFAYYNVGHSNLTERVLRSVQYASGSNHVLIHDVIPLEHPEFQRSGTILPFRGKLKRVRRLATRVIYNSQDTRLRAEALMQKWGTPPPAIVAHLGIVMPVADMAAVPPGLKPDRPYFVVVGTIEPRKNHAFLLDLWDELGVDAPPLLICGSRGWNNDVVFARLDALSPDSPVQEIADLDDPALFALVQGSAGTLFPSLAEGFGLPPIEALALGARVLCNDLAVFHEILGDRATIAPVSDTEMWIKTVKSWENTSPHASKEDNFVGPNWPNHFKTVLRLR